MLEHGGGLRRAAEEFGIPVSEWLDLSTGINPVGWQVAELPARVWQRLPEDEDGLERAAARYYGSRQLLAVAGSQAAIQMLPRAWKPTDVGILSPTYGEHARAWREAGHRTHEFCARAFRSMSGRLDVLIAVHPNNPSGEELDIPFLLEAAQRCAARGGCLVVDEAFVDARPERSLARYAGHDGLVVLRSAGKFFGLAGIRLGFVLAERELLDTLGELLGPWAVSGPARWVGAKALADASWQAQARERLRNDSARLAELLTARRLPPAGGTTLFQWVPTPRAAELRTRLAQRGILVRAFARPPSLRFGLPAGEDEWARLEAALAEIV